MKILRSLGLALLLVTTFSIAGGTDSTSAVTTSITPSSNFSTDYNSIVNQLISENQELAKKIEELEKKINKGSSGGGSSSGVGRWSCGGNSPPQAAGGMCSPKGKVSTGANGSCTCR